MPKISLVGVLSAAAAAGPAAPGAQSTAHEPADSSPAAEKFLDQLKSALATLAGAALPKSSASTAASADESAADATAPLLSDLPSETASADDEQADGMPELLASLGFMLVPNALPTAAVVAEPETAAEQHGIASIATADPSAAAGATQADPAAPVQPAPSELPAPSDGPAPQHASQAAPTPTAASAQTLDFSSVTTAQAPNDAASIADALANASTAAPAPPPAHAAQADAAPTPMATSTVAHSTFGQSAFGQSTSGHGNGQAAHDSSAPSTESSSDSASIQDAARANDRSFADVAAAMTTANTSATALPAHVRPSEVVNQIAHQADLYRLPGNKGVRIQLSPDDLGGVDVTLRYSAAGGVQLHINVEHASTGHLVQSGWTELRDALATQGISPERLVMSISAPNDAGGLNFSSNGSNGGRPNAGLDSFSQGQSSGQQQAQDDQQRRTSRGRNPTVESTSSVSDAAVTVASASSARIDYRV